MYKILPSPLNQEQNPSSEFSFAVYKLDLHSMIRTSGDDGKHDPVEENVDDTTSLSPGFACRKCGEDVEEFVVTLQSYVKKWV